MRTNYKQSEKIFARLLRWLPQSFMLLAVMVMMPATMSAQSAFSITTAPPLTGATTTTAPNGTTFNLKAKLAAIKVTNIHTDMPGNGTWEIWYKTDSINGAPVITTANGWILHESGSYTGGAGIVNLNMKKPLSIPAGKTYGMYVFNTTQSVRYHSFAAGNPVLFADANLQLYMGPSVSYVVYPTGNIANRMFKGTVYYDFDFKAPNDAGLTELTSPTGANCAGTRDVRVRVMNFGSNQISSVKVNWSIDGVLQSPYTHSTTIDTAGGSGASSVVVPLGTVALTTTPKTLKMWTSDPNNQKDTVGRNDTITAVVRASFSGTYTIGASGADFPNVAAAASAISASGVCGPVVFNVQAGTYTGQVELKDVAGVSATNTITFDGGNGNTSTRIIRATGPSLTEAHTFRINNTSFVRIRNLTFQTTGTAQGLCLQIFGPCVNVRVSNCKMEITGTPATGTSNNFKGVEISGSLSADQLYHSGTGAALRDILIDSNEIIAGGYGVHVFGVSATSTDIVVSNNVLRNTYDVGISFNNTNGAKALYNRLFMRSNGSNNGVGIYYYNANSTNPNFNEMTGNIIYNAGYAGIWLATSSSGTGTRGKIVNNLIGGGFRSASAYGIYATYPARYDIWHNTINLDRATSSNQNSAISFPLTGTSTTANDIRNNNLVYSATSGSGLPLYLAGTTPVTRLEYNNYYNAASTTLAFIEPGTYTADNIKGAMGYNNVFFNVAPSFVSNLDLHYDQTVAPLYGDNTLGVLVDVDGDPRCVDAPTVGGDESKYPFPRPTAGFTHPDTIYVNNAVEFLNRVSATSPYRHRWYVNGTQVATTNDLLRGFTTAGNTTVAVVSYGCGTKDSFSKVINIVNPSSAPVADFSVNKNVISVGESVDFRDLSKGGPSSWAWEITPKMAWDATMGMMVPAYSFRTGDSTSQHPTVTFDYAGSYTICLKATNSFGSSNICRTRYVRVKENIAICNTSESVSNKNYGIITDDGGATGNYTNNKRCNFLISPCSPNLGLKIKEFNMAANDFLRIYDGSDNTAPALYDLKAFPNGMTGNRSTIPGFPDTIMSKSGKIYFEFITDNATVAPGFEIEWFADSFNTTAPVAQFDIPDTICYGLNVQLTNRSAGFGNIYFWDYDNDGLIDATEENPVGNFLVVGPQEIKLVVENCGGRDSIIKTVYVTDPTTGPQVDFVTNMISPNAGTDIVTLSDRSFRCVDSWRWSFSPGSVTFVNGTNATSQNPQVRFNTSGCYDVKLVAGYRGVHDSTTKSCFIRATTYCVPTVSIRTNDIGIAGVTIGNMSNSTPIAEVAYTDYTATHSVTAMKSVPVSFSISRQTNFNAMSGAIWVDLNHDGDFDDAGERVAFNNSIAGRVWTGNFTIPQSATLGGTRLRIGTNLANVDNLACGTNRNGEYEDYRINIIMDQVPPILTLLGLDTVYMQSGSVYTDSGATAMDNVDGDISANIVVTGLNFNRNLMGTYRIRYNVQDAAGNRAQEISRVIIVTADTVAPVITLTGGDTVYVEVFSPYTEPGYIAIDSASGEDYTLDVVASGSVNVNVLGVYPITYTVEDPSGNISTKRRIVIVRDTEKPVVELIGADTVYIEINASYTDSGITYSDNYWQNLTVDVVSNVDTSRVGTYSVAYTVTDSSGNMSSVTRTVIIRDTEVPVIRLNGPDTLVVDVHTPYYELGATATDNSNGNNIRVVITGTVNTDSLGFYRIVYTAVDAQGNAADTVTRIVHVVDRRAPVVTLRGGDVVRLVTGQSYTDSGYTVTDNHWPVSTLTIETLGDFVNTDSPGVYFIQYKATDGSGNVGLSQKRIIYVGVNSIAEANALEGAVKVFPNPASNGMFNVEITLPVSQNVKVSIVNMLGQEIRTIHTGNLSAQRFPVEMAEKAGMYFVKVQTPDATIMKPVVLTK